MMPVVIDIIYRANKKKAIVPGSSNVEIDKVINFETNTTLLSADCVTNITSGC